MAIPIGTIISAAAQALSMYKEIKAAMEADGMDPDEFDAAVAVERARVKAWEDKTDAAEDAEFDSPSTPGL